MPSLNFGVYEIKPNKTKETLLKAFDIGYRSIDTAKFIIMKKKLVK